jgi:predicted tellurium resistance membrane protein TerC
MKEAAIWTGVWVALSLGFNLIDRFVYLRPALAVILTFIGFKMLLTDVYHLPTTISLAFVALVLLTAIGLSLIAKRERARVGPGVKSNRDFLPVAKQPAGN